MNTINWGEKDKAKDNHNPMSASSLYNLPWLVREFGHGRLPLGWRETRVFENRNCELPSQDIGYYKEYYLGPFPESHLARVVLGQGGEVYVAWTHHRNFIQVLQLPGR